MSFKGLGQYKESIAPIEEARRILVKERGKDDGLVFITEMNLVEAYTKLERFTDAAPYVNNMRKYAISEERFGEDYREKAQAIIASYFKAQGLPLPDDIALSK